MQNRIVVASEINLGIGVLMFKSTLCLLVASGIVAGCATRPVIDHGTGNANAGGPDVQCHTVQLTGSMIGKNVCTTKAERDAQQSATDELKHNVESRVGGCPNSQQCQQ
jgi:hypothetical protein